MGATTNQNPAVMANPRKKFCGHIPCLCTVPEGDEYCGRSCQDAARSDAEIACYCDHIACPCTIGRFTDRSADLQGL